MKAYVTLTSFANNKEAMGLLSMIANQIVVRSETERPKKEELKNLVSKYDILIIGVKEKMDLEVFNSASKLKYLLTLSIGVDHIDPVFFDTSKIKVISCSTANIQTVAEFVFAKILSSTKSFEECNTAFLNESGREGIKNMPSELSSKTIGVIGAGRIAQKFFEISSVFNFKKLCWTFHPELHNDMVDNYNINFVTLDYLMENSDYVVILIPYSQETKELISADLLKRAKHNVKIINVSRVGIINMEAFSVLVKNGKFSGSHIDCFFDEISKNSINIFKDSISFSPHVAGISVESRKRMSYEVAVKLFEEVNNA